MTDTSLRILATERRPGRSGGRRRGQPEAALLDELMRRGIVREVDAAPAVVEPASDCEPVGSFAQPMGLALEPDEFDTAGLWARVVAFDEDLDGEAPTRPFRRPAVDEEAPTEPWKGKVCRKSELEVYPRHATTRFYRRPTKAAQPQPGRARRRQSGQLRPGDTVGRCLVVEQIGRGGTCTVYRALHQGLNVPVALKVLRGGVDFDEQELNEAEAQLLARLQHPNVVGILDCCLGDGHGEQYLVLELVDGLSLAELIGQTGALRPQRAVSLLLGIARALHHAHESGIVHRDLKPHNVLVGRDGVARLADLGIATVLGNTALNDCGEDAFYGTPAYIAPEVIKGESQGDHRSDLYGFGATLFHALTGRAPFCGTAEEVFCQHVEVEAPRVDELVADCPRGLADLVARLLAKDPYQRPASYEELIEALEPYAMPGRASGPRRTKSGFWGSLRLLMGLQEGA